MGVLSSWVTFAVNSWRMTSASTILSMRAFSSTCCSLRRLTSGSSSSYGETAFPEAVSMASMGWTKRRASERDTTHDTPTTTTTVPMTNHRSFAMTRMMPSRSSESLSTLPESRRCAW